ncbi:MAG: methyltransferase family protein [Desulfobaccales bacterium]
MALQEEFTSLGNRFFRWRSYLPLCMALLFLAALWSQPNAASGQHPGRPWQMGCLLISLAGLGLRFLTVGFAPRGTSGRNTRGQMAETLNTTGAYSLVRNPLYLGNFLIWLGLSLFLGVWWCTVIVILCFILFYERIIFAEEAFLREKFAAAFGAWAAGTPAIIPRFRNWRAPALPFSWKSALRREYSSWFATITSFTVLAILRDSLQNRRLILDRDWLIIFGCTLAIYLTVRTLKKKTQILSTVDR